MPDEQFGLERSTCFTAIGGIRLLVPFCVLDRFIDGGTELHMDVFVITKES